MSSNGKPASSIKGLPPNAHNGNVSGFSLDYHVGRSFASREGDHHMRLAFFQHTPITYRAGCVPVAIPVGWIGIGEHVALKRPVCRERISAPRCAVDETYNRIRRVRGIENAEQLVAVIVIPSAAN